MIRIFARAPALRRGFTLVELMIVVAIIGVLASLAIYGVRRYLASAKSAEARNTLGEIQRAAVAAYERESAEAALLNEGDSSHQAVHHYCDSAPPVPAAVPPGKKYQPDTTYGKDFNTGTAISGWKCLRFSMSEPIYYQYAYTRQGRAITTKVDFGETVAWSAEAAGDLDGDGERGEFITFGTSNNGQPKTATQIRMMDPEE